MAHSVKLVKLKIRCGNWGNVLVVYYVFDNAFLSFLACEIKQYSENVCVPCYVVFSRGVVIKKGTLFLIPVKSIYMLLYVIPLLLTAGCGFFVPDKSGTLAKRVVSLAKNHLLSTNRPLGVKG